MLRHMLLLLFTSFRRPNVSRILTSHGRGSCNEHMRLPTWCSAAWETRLLPRCCLRVCLCSNNTHNVLTWLWNRSLSPCSPVAPSPPGAAGALSEVSVRLPGEEAPDVPSFFLCVRPRPAGDPGSGLGLTHYTGNTHVNRPNTSDLSLLSHLIFVFILASLSFGSLVVFLFLLFLIKSHFKSKFPPSLSQAHLLSLFDNVNRVVFSEKNYDQILSFQSQEGETVELSQPVLAQVHTKTGFKAQFLSTDCMHFFVDWGFETFTVIGNHLRLSLNLLVSQHRLISESATQTEAVRRDLLFVLVMSPPESLTNIKRWWQRDRERWPLGGRERERWR